MFRFLNNKTTACNRVGCLFIFTWLFLFSVAVCSAGSLEEELMEAVRTGNTAKVATLIRAGADVNYKDVNESTPLMVAPWFGYSEIIRLLLEAGADPNAKNRMGTTPLLQAVLGGRQESVRILLEGGADVNLAGMIDTYQGRTPLMEAIMARVAPRERSRRELGQIAEILIRAGANVNAHDMRGRTALHEAISDLEMVKLLVDAGADVNAVDETGTTILMLASRGRTEPVKILLQARVNVVARNREKKTALDWAIEYRQQEVIRMLLADPRITPDLLEHLRDHDKNVRIRSTRALAHAKDRTAIEPLLQILPGEKDPDVREAVLSFLRAMVQLFRQTKDRGSVRWLIQFLDIPDSSLSIDSILALEAIGDRSAIPALRKHLWEPEYSLAVYRALVNMGDRSYADFAWNAREILTVLAVLLLAALGFITEKNKKAWLVRLAIAPFASAMIGFLIGVAGLIVFTAMIASSNLKGEGFGIAVIYLSITIASYFAFLTMVTAFVRIEGTSRMRHAFFLSAFSYCSTLIVIPSLYHSSWTDILMQHTDSRVSVLSFNLLFSSVFYLASILFAGILERLRKTIGDLRSDRLTAVVFWTLLLGVLSPFWLPPFILRVVVDAITALLLS